SPSWSFLKKTHKQCNIYFPRGSGWGGRRAPVKKQAETFVVRHTFSWRCALKPPQSSCFCLQERAKCVLAGDLVADGTLTHICPLLTMKEAPNGKRSADHICCPRRCRCTESTLVGNGLVLDEIER